METATNPETGEKVMWDGSAWQPVPSATNPETGSKAFLIDNNWVTEKPEDVPYSEQVKRRWEEFSPADIGQRFFTESARRRQILEGESGQQRPADEFTATYLSQGLRSATELALGAANVLISDNVRENAKAAWETIKDTPIIENIAEVVSSGMDAYQSWKEKNPQDAETFETYVDIASVLTPQVKVRVPGVKQTKQIAEITSKADKLNRVEKMMMPDNFEGNGRVVETGLLRKKKYIPTDREQRINQTLSDVSEFNPNRSYTYNTTVVEDTIESTNNQLLREIGQAGNPKFDLDEVVVEMTDAINDITDSPQFRLLTGDAQAKAQEFAETALDMLRNSDGTAMGLLQTRREFDKFLSAGQRNVFDPTIESAKSVAGSYVRNVLNNKLKAIIPGDAVQESLDKMHNLLSAKDVLVTKRAKEASNVISRVWSNVKDVANLPSTPLALYATLATGAGLASSSVLVGAGTAGATYGIIKTLSKANQMKFYATLMSGIDKALKAYNSDKNLVARLKADRAVILELMRDTKQEEDNASP